MLVEFCSINKTLASTIGFCFAILVNYTMQCYLVFPSNVSHRNIFTRYLAVNLIMLVVNDFIFERGIIFFPSHYLVVQIAVAIIISFVNYLVNSHITFKERFF